MKNSREDNLNSKIKSAEKRIKELDFEREKEFKQINKWNKALERIKLSGMEEYCKKQFPNRYFRYVKKNEKYATMWIIHFDKFDGMEDDCGVMVGKYISLTYNKEDILESFLFDTNARILIDDVYDDGFSGYFKKDDFIVSTKEAFDGAKKLMTDFINKD